jgi:endonuclease/exonuclease/phosphatase family metal-dependent hydrolase
MKKISSSIVGLRARQLPLVALLFVTGLGRLPAATGEPAVVADGLNIVSWNIEWFPGQKNFARREEMQAQARIVEAEITKLNPDILLAQEIRDWESFTTLCDHVPGLRAAAVSAFPSQRTGEYWRQQIAIGSKLPVLAAWSEAWKAGNAVHPPRGFTAAVIRLPGPAAGRHLLVYSLHLKSNLSESDEETAQNFRERDESARQLLAHVHEMVENVFKGSIVGIVVGGDFNTNQDGQFGDRVMKIMSEAGFYQTWAETPADQRASWRGGGKRGSATFDHIFTKGLGAPKAELIEVPGEASDHWPVRIVIPEADLAKAQPLVPAE